MPASASRDSYSLWAAAVAAVVVAAVSVPYLVAGRTTPAGEVYVGLAAWPADQLSYLMWMRQAAEGGPYYDLMTAEAHPPLTPPLFWVALGKIAAATGLKLVVVYHVSRVVLAALYLWLLWRVLGVWVQSRPIRLFAFTAIAGGSGFGWLARLVGSPAMPVDQAMPELWSFSSMLYYPHFTASLLLLAAAMYSLWQLWWAKGGRPALAWAALAVAALLIAVVHPYTFVPLAGTLALFVAVPPAHAGTSRARRVAAAAGLLPGAAFLVWMKAQAMAHPVLRQWMEQNALPSPGPLGYVQGFGAVGVIAAALIVADLASAMARDPDRAQALGTPLLAGVRPDPVGSFAFVWALVAFLLAYAFPAVPFARRCVEGAHIFLVLLAASALGTRLELLARRAGPAALAAATAAALWPMSAILAADAAGPQAVRLPADVAAAWRFIEQKLPPDAAIFCRPADGQYIPAMTGRRVFVGHFHLTPRYRMRSRQAEKFFAASTDEGLRRRILADSGCGWVLANSVPRAVSRALERMLGPPAFQQGQVAVYSAAGAGGRGR